MGSTDEERLLIARALDKVQAAEVNWEKVRGDFHDPSQAIMIKKTLSMRHGEAQVFFYGGYEQAERARACFGRPDWPPGEEDFGLSLIRIHGDTRFFTPTHRDVLGAMMAQGIKREKIGDVILFAGDAFVVVDKDLAAGVALDSVGKAPVSTELVPLQALQEYQPEFTTHTAITASLRLDAVIASVYNLSRSESAALVSRGAAKLNHLPCSAGAKEIKPGDLISVRGQGRAYIREVIGTTQKGRLRLRVERPV